MPYGRATQRRRRRSLQGFNPSYGLHALRACLIEYKRYDFEVSIPHMGCMPYGPRMGRKRSVDGDVSIPRMGCMPYGLNLVEKDYNILRCFNPSYGLHALRARLPARRTTNLL